MLTYIKRYYIVVLLCSYTLFNKLYSQDNILEQQLAITKYDTAKANVYLKYASLLTSENPIKSFDYVKKGIYISKQYNFEQGIASGYYVLGKLYDNISTDTSYFYYIEALKIEQKLKRIYQIAQIYNSLGTHFQKLQNPNLALVYYFKSIKIFEILNHENGIAASYMGIGNVFLNKQNSKRALQYYHQSIDSYKKTKSPKISGPMANAAIIYNELGQTKKAKDMLEQALYISIKNNDFYYGAYITDEIGNLLLKEKKYKESLVYFFKSLKIKREKQLANALFANSYSYISETYLAINENEKALSYLDSLEPIVYQLKSNNLKLSFLEDKSKYYKNIGDYKNAYNYISSYSFLKDSLSTDEMYKKIAEADAKHKSEKKQKEIELLNKDNLIQKLKIDENKKQRNVFIIGVICLLFLLAYIYKQYIQKQKINELIVLQKKQVENKSSIIAQKQKEILDSINYAKRIQYAQLANVNILTKNLNSYFIFFKPKDIVSGDFYWATEHNNKFYLAVCDCTGHGVPGAFMSLLSINFLNEAIKDKCIIEPNNVLNYVRQRIIDNTNTDNAYDGMDGILLCKDLQTNQITYSASNNNPLLIQNNKLIVLPKDKMPVGKGEKTNSFTLFNINAQNGDVLYLLTDGYADQFGGHKQKKLKRTSLYQLLVSVSEQPINLQHKIIEDSFNSWKADLEQVDDVLVIGISI